MIPLAGVPRTHSPIAFNGRITGHGFGGAHSVQLDNGHRLTAYPAAGEAPRAIGASVSVELAHDEMKGWRLKRRS